jgi:DNA polymerase I-like protein with 3'-5' exonuclease and polymerase domains
MQMAITAPDCIAIDFETMPIRQRPAYPPAPVGVSIRWPGQRSNYHAWGHPDGNNCSMEDARAELQAAWDSGLPLLFHHSKFDVAVATERLGLPMPRWDRIHDTMFLAYLADPHSRAIGLKELAAELLQWPAEEKDELKAWILANQKMLVARWPELRELNKEGKPKDSIAPSKVGAWIFATPGQLAGKYAMGDTDRTVALFQELYPLVLEHGMGYAYDTERELMPILIENEREGMRADVRRLEQDVTGYGWAMDTAEDWLRRELRASGLNFDADADVASVLADRGVVPAENWQTTDSGQLSMSKDNLLPEHFTGPNGGAVASALGYRNRLKTCLKMFMEPWLNQASSNGGYITTNWNQTRGTDQGGGTRTGRPSTNKHNFLNVSKKWDGRDDQYVHPAFLKVPELPLCRSYVTPDKGETWMHRDFSGQEMRIFGHFEQGYEAGDLWRSYNDNPELDPHDGLVGPEMQRVAGREIERTKIKTLNFQGIYGGGVPALQRKLRCSLAEAKQLKDFHNRVLPGRKILNDEIKKVINLGLPIRTLGGRLYFAEPPGPDGRSKIYKLLNYLVQGSAADMTKRALIDWHNHPQRDARFLVTVYDEINGSAGDLVRQMAILRDVMQAPRLGMTVKMLSDAKYGPNWGELTKGEPK